MKRREFIQRSALTVASLATMPALLQAKSKSDIGLQLYSLRDTIPNDPKGVLKKVAGFGYGKIETYAYSDGKIFGMAFKDFGNYVKDLGMKITSGHYPLALAKSDKWEMAVADAKSVGQKFMVVPYLNEPERRTIDDYKSICEALNKAGEVCNKNGIRFGYHNHNFEFETIDGQLPYDVMLAELDPKLVSMEMDIYWVYRAGKDALDYFKKYPGRFEQWHVKDMDKTNPDKNADVGTGSLDWKKIFAQAKQSGLKHFYIEQESYPAAPIDSIEASIKNLKNIL
ncbi:sugar phosphate isomerase/epimerase family protein [Chryseosolibacter indicus]|uniref:Sugar phosphate isomerase/epimerase n=1 Tax=Chryseosolibacter indicus TaxID=2782351 RepID=A0ABS5VLD6_9BACT|nr:sugar phosphate isomerase/epimerase [Chryseosolibacter indicus]MBT1701813.1 sugar phosphate isomerase/epimerase [Chryseosolibacter indicus]